MAAAKKQITGMIFDLDGTLVDSETKAHYQFQEAVAIFNKCAAPADGSTPEKPPEFSYDIHKKILGTGSTIWPRIVYDSNGIWYDGPVPTTDGASSDASMTEEERAKNFADKMAAKEKNKKWVWKSDPPIDSKYASEGEVIPKAGMDVTPEDFTALSHAVGIMTGYDVALMPGVADFFAALKDHPEFSKVPLSVATSSRRKYAQLKLDSHKDKTFASGVFKTLTCGNDPEVENCKPAPDLFLLAKDKVREWRKENLPEDAQHKPEEELWVVFEDSPAGVKAGKDADCHVFILQDSRYNDGSNPWMKLADTHLKSDEKTAAISGALAVLESMVGYAA